LSGKQDLIPNKINSLWIDPDAPGLYVGQCARYCGTAHAKMLLRVYVDTPADFAAWVSHQRQPAVQDPAASEGRAVFEKNACINCHTIAGTVATGRFGPDLTHLASRDTIAAGPVPLTPANLRAWIDNPDTFKPGSRMPAMHLNQHDLNAVTAYLMTLK
jgi:cytochrome c oxidase subunit 2